MAGETREEVERNVEVPVGSSRSWGSGVVTAASSDGSAPDFLCKSRGMQSHTEPSPCLIMYHILSGLGFTILYTILDYGVDCSWLYERIRGRTMERPYNGISDLFFSKEGERHIYITKKNQLTLPYFDVISNLHRRLIATEYRV